MLEVPISGTTIPFAVQVKLGASTVLLKPAPKGSGVIAGGPVRSVVDAAGIRDISSKIKGTSNKASNVYATFEALRQIKQIVKLKGIELKSAAAVEEEEKAKLRELDEKAKQIAPATKKVEATKPVPAERTKKVLKPKVKKVVAAKKKTESKNISK
jgi:small subunit ribosomal protein S5